MPGDALAEETRATLRLAWPIVLTNLTQFALTLTDVLFLGRLGTEALAGATLGANLYWALLAPVFGLALAAAPLCAQTRGRGRGFVRGMRRDLRAAVWAAAFGVLPVWAVLSQAEGILLALGQEPALARMAADYIHALMWGMLPFCAFVALRGFLEAHARPIPALLVATGGIALNVPLNALLIHGWGMVPPLGVVGAGLASTLCNIAMLIGLVAVVSLERRLRRLRPFGRLWRFDGARLREVAAVGLPIAGSMMLEIGVFSASALAMGWLGAVAVAAHAIVVQVASLTYMVPMGIGQAATARVGVATGAGRPRDAGRAGWLAVAIGAAFMVASGAVLLSIPGAIAWLFLDPANPGAAETAALAATLLMLAGVFQLADGVQSVAGGALRGLKDTRVPMGLAALGYWGVGLPLGLALAFPAGVGPAGIWAGLAAGLFLVAALMLRRWAALSGGLRRPAIG
ncbi:MAG TPA: MATE family efflux transporter [Acetobacteraceae bacterium]|nr:MATE family efflux transporter [Acetobacteraceae bacterium]